MIRKMKIEKGFLSTTNYKLYSLTEEEIKIVEDFEKRQVS